MNNDQIIKLFLNGEVSFSDIEKQTLEINFSFKLVQFSIFKCSSIDLPHEQ